MNRGREGKGERGEHTTTVGTVERQAINLTDSSETGITDELPSKKQWGHYHSYSLRFKISVVAELVYNPGGVIAEKHNLPR